MGGVLAERQKDKFHIGVIVVDAIDVVVAVAVVDVDVEADFEAHFCQSVQ